MVMRLVFIVADPTGSFYRSVDQVLPAAKYRIVSATEALQIFHIGLGKQEVFLMVEDDRVGGGVDVNSVEQACRTTALRVTQSS